MFFRKAIITILATLPLASVSLAAWHITDDSTGKVAVVLHPLAFCQLAQSHITVLNDGVPILDAGTKDAHVADGGDIFRFFTRDGMKFWIQFDQASPMPLVRLSGNRSLLDRNTGNFAIKLENGTVYRLEIPSWREIRLTRLNGVTQDFASCQPGRLSGR
jgi:hypothetical protein